MNSLGKSIVVIVTIFTYLFGSCNISCDYAVYDYYNEDGSLKDGFQIIFHSFRGNHIQLIGRNMNTREYWKFSEGDFILFNDEYKILHDPESHYLDSYTSSELTEEEVDFILNGWVTKIVISQDGKTIEVILDPEKSEDFRNIFNCNNERGQKKYENL